MIKKTLLGLSLFSAIKLACAIGVTPLQPEAFSFTMDFSSPYTVITPPVTTNNDILITNVVLGKCTTQAAFNFGLSTSPNDFSNQDSVVGVYNNLSFSDPDGFIWLFAGSNNKGEIPDGTPLYANWQAVSPPIDPSASCEVLVFYYVFGSSS